MIPEEIRLQFEELASSGKKIDVSDMHEQFIDSHLRDYHVSRDRYAQEGTSQISRHLNTGTISARTVYTRLAQEETDGEGWLRQLAWRDFYLYQARLDAESAADDYRHVSY